MPSDQFPNPEGQRGKMPPPPPPKRGVSVPPKHVYTQDGKPVIPAASPKGEAETPSVPPRREAGAPAAPPRREAKTPPGSPPERRTAQRPAAIRKKPDIDPGPDDDMESEWRGIKLRKKRPVNNGCMRGALYFVVMCIISLVLAINIWSWTNDVLALTKEEGFVSFVIPSDYDYKSLSLQLRDLGVIEHAWLFEMYCDLSDAQKYIDPGERTVDTSHDYRALVRDLRHVEEKVQVKITFPEGFTLEEIVELLVENGVAKRESLLQSIQNDDFGYSFLEELPATENRLEGYLFPDTYFFYTDENPRSALRKFLAAFNQKLSKTMRNRIEEMPYSLHEILTIASLVEAEAANAGEMKDIASVIYNRLNSSSYPYLEIDAALIYVMDGRRVITVEDKEMDSPYNLYKTEGLPPGPICSPSVNAIRAALYPSHTSFYFYAMTEAGTHQFSKTLAEHNQVKRNNPGIYGD